MAAPNPPATLGFEEASRQLLSEGSPFALAEEEVRGERMQVYARRPPHLRALLEGSVEKGDAEYLVFDDGRRFSYAEHARCVASVAAALRERFGVGKGDRVAILGANCPEWILTHWALVSLGAVNVAMNGWWAGDEIRYGLELSEPELLVADERRLARLEGESPGVPTVVIERDFSALVDHDHDRAAPLPDVEIREDDPAVLLFTSGTTGRPKGALISHRNIVAFTMTTLFLGARRMMTEPRPLRAPGATLAVFPLFHLSGLFGSTTAGLAGGAKLVWPTGRFDAGKVLRLSREEDVTNWSGAATHVFRLLDHPDFASFDASSLTGLGIGGSATTPEFVRRAGEGAPQLRGTFGSGYGSSETGGLVSYANSAMLAEASDCVGPPLPTVQVKIVDDEGEELPPGGEGHIAVRSPMVMLGYWRNDEANAESFLPGGWVKTGDVGRMEDGRLHLASRKRDLILRGGENIYPIEIENRLEQHPGVLEAAVLGVEHPELGQEVKAVVVPRPGNVLEADEVRRFVAEKLASYKVPALVEVRAEPLPRNATGKVMKHVLSGEGENTFVEE
ncbi:MAG: class I adenylate-forming enzyme family protein [Myxococcota bacterium]|nr:class I adenylate-forming enzyme family protein [Myxococcota bacterium]